MVGVGAERVKGRRVVRRRRRRREKKGGRWEGGRGMVGVMCLVVVVAGGWGVEAVVWWPGGLVEAGDVECNGGKKWRRVMEQSDAFESLRRTDAVAETG